MNHSISTALRDRLNVFKASQQSELIREMLGDKARLISISPTRVQHLYHIPPHASVLSSHSSHTLERPDRAV